MALIYRYQYKLVNFAGAPGYTSFYSDGSVIDPEFFATFWESVINFFPGGLTVECPDSYDEIEDTTGVIVSSGAITPHADIPSTLSSAPFAGMAGILIKWLCGAVRVGGRRVYGRTFMVPVSSQFFSNDGKLVSSVQTAFQNAATNLLASVSPHLVVWNRPYPGRGVIVRPGKPDLPARPARAGSYTLIVTANVPDEQATLRSRRQ